MTVPGFSSFWKFGVIFVNARCDPFEHPRAKKFSVVCWWLTGFWLVSRFFEMQCKIQALVPFSFDRKNAKWQGELERVYASSRNIMLPYAVCCYQ